MSAESHSAPDLAPAPDPGPAPDPAPTLPWRLVTLNDVRDDRGLLTVGETDRGLPFVARRFFYLREVGAKAGAAMPTATGPSSW